MALKPSSIAEHPHDAKEAARENDLTAIDDLIRECKSRMSSASDLSSATKSQLAQMYDDMRGEAERDELRAARLQMMKENVGFLQQTIEKAAAQRSRFESELDQAARSGWIRPESKNEWMAKFDNPDTLEMYRDMWLKNEWPGYKERWRKLAVDRTEVLNRARAAGLDEHDIPELATLSNDAAYFAKDRTYAGRRSLVDTVDTGIGAAKTGKMRFFRETETMLKTVATGPGRCLHPAKVGEWLRRTMQHEDPRAFRDTVVVPFIANWKEARSRYDELTEQFNAHGKPDGCAPPPLHTFLAQKYEARMAIVAEWNNRLAAAERMKTDEMNGLERAKVEVRHSIDLHDFDVAERRLDALRTGHADDPDLRTISEHLAILRQEAREEEERTDDEKTAEALMALETMSSDVPSVLSRHYAYLIENGNADQAAAFFLSMKVRTDRRKAGETDDEHERLVSEAADAAEEVTVMDAATETDEPTDTTELIVTKDTPPSETLALINAHSNARVNRSPALVIEGLSYEQQLQMVELNKRTLDQMRHLDRVGKPYKAPSAPEEALAA